MTHQTDDLNEQINGQEFASSSYRAADLIGQIERLRCSIIGLLNECGRLHIALQCESHPRACETPTPDSLPGLYEYDR